MFEPRMLAKLRLSFQRVATGATWSLELELESGSFQQRHLRLGTPRRYVGALLTIPTVEISSYCLAM